jgi:hypothetical protein
MVMSIYDMSDSCDKISKMSYVRREPIWLFSKVGKLIHGCFCSGPYHFSQNLYNIASKES